MWTIASYSDMGTRAANEDRISITELGNCACITLADGVGGHGGGSTAANAVTKRLKKLFEESCPKAMEPDQMRLVLDQVNATVVSLQTSRCRLQATCVTLWLEACGDGKCSALWANVGDSRLYYFRNNKYCTRTQDHSMKELWKDEKEPEAELGRNVIWQAMGEPEGIRPDISEVLCLQGGNAAFLLCSDGLWECVDTEKMEELLADSKTPEEWLEHLRDAMRRTGKDSYDNNSAAAVFVTLDTSSLPK